MSASHIVSDPNVMMGKPLVAGTRITSLWNSSWKNSLPEHRLQN